MYLRLFTSVVSLMLCILNSYTYPGMRLPISRVVAFPFVSATRTSNVPTLLLRRKILYPTISVPPSDLEAIHDSFRRTGVMTFIIGCTRIGSGDWQSVLVNIDSGLY